MGVPHLARAGEATSMVARPRTQTPAETEVEPFPAPRIRYATTADGVRIAFWTFGDGPPLVYMAGGPWSHMELLEAPQTRRWYERLARGRMLVRYDMRGTGFSERAVADYALDALALDVEAVADRLGLGRFALLGAADAGPVAIALAARHPERVSRLVLWCAWARTADIRSARIRAWLGLIDQDWELLTDTCAHIVLGWSGAEVGQDAVERLRKNVTQEAARAALLAMGETDVTHLLPRPHTPTLVLHRQSISWLPVSIARALAAQIPHARLLLLEGESPAPYLGDTEAAANAIDEFLREDEAAESVPAKGLRRQEPQAKTADKFDGLTHREVQVLRLLASGRMNSEIAKELVLSVRTVENHVARIYEKIGARGRAMATAYALTRGLLLPPGE
jgi:pimeloyl-ACP methyl ester carboxylesterase/DNA-binding CsgD family transcriptional regulator